VPSTDTRPNIVLVVADDLGIGDVGFYAHKLKIGAETYKAQLIDTPVIDRLAVTGVACDAMYAPAGQDSPSRAGMLTGRHAARYGIMPGSVRPDRPGGLPPDATTVASLLQEAGYATGLFGQWRLGSGGGQHPLDHGFERFSGTLYGTDVSPLAWYEDRTVDESDFDPALAAQRITKDAIAFSDEHQRSGAGGSRRPFFAVLTHLVPHQPYRVEGRFVGRSGPAGLYGDAVEMLDFYLGQLVRHLRERTNQRTLVIFTSDNGPRYEGRTLGRNGRKPELFDGGVVVPFIASWLSGGRGKRDAVPRSLLDLTPSFCVLAGVTPPGDLDGEDMSELLLGRGTPSRGPVFLFWNEHLFAMRSGRWKFHEWGVLPDPIFRPFFAAYWPNLYDLETDFREEYTVQNLYPDVAAQLRAQLLAKAAEVEAERTSRAQGGAA